jgi:predicted secreted protein
VGFFIVAIFAYNTKRHYKVAKIDGRFIRLEFGTGTYIKGLTTSSFNGTADMIDATNYESDGWKDFLAGEKGGTITATFLFDDSVSSANTADVINAWLNGTTTAFVWGHHVTGSDILSGSCLISDLTWDGPKNEASSVNATLQITGEVTLDVAP